LLAEVEAVNTAAAAVQVDLELLQVCLLLLVQLIQ
jgi:hypothetical protein